MYSLCKKYSYVVHIFTDHFAMAKIDRCDVMKTTFQSSSLIALLNLHSHNDDDETTGRRRMNRSGDSIYYIYYGQGRS